MTAILWLESKKRLRGSLLLVGVFALLLALYYSIYPSFADDSEELVEAFPDWMFEFFGLDAFHTIEGFIAGELYAFFWVVLLGVYFAYLGAGMITQDVRSRRMDLILSTSTSRESVLLQNVASLWVPLFVLNVSVGIFVYLGSVLINETMNPVAIAMVHVLSVPYLLVCAALGLFLSAVFGYSRSARGAALGLVVVLWLVEGVSNLSPDFDWLGDLTPQQYFDPTAVLVHNEYAVVDAGILLVTFVILVGVTTLYFTRQDL